jgi:hypothetical protein
MDDKVTSSPITCFRALGDVVHLIEDMAQPQHTRNDRHAGKKYDEAGGPNGMLGHKSAYEAWIDARATGGQFNTEGALAGTQAPISVTPPPFSNIFVNEQNIYPNGYPVPRFADYLSFFTTRKKYADIGLRQGLADYSNRGFFSAGKNLDPRPDAESPYPNNNFPSYGQTEITTNWEGQPGNRTFAGSPAPYLPRSFA